MGAQPKGRESFPAWSRMAGDHQCCRNSGTGAPSSSEILGVKHSSTGTTDQSHPDPVRIWSRHREGTEELGQVSSSLNRLELALGTNKTPPPNTQILPLALGQTGRQNSVVTETWGTERGE